MSEWRYHGGVETCHVSGLEHSCARAVSSTVFGIFTFLACTYKLYYLIRGHQIPATKPIVMAMATLESALLTAKWIFGLQLWAHFVSIYLGVLSFLLICLFYVGLVLRITSKRDLIFRLGYPLGTLVALYFTGVLVWSLIEKTGNKAECRKIHWILFSSSQLVLLLVFAITGYYLSKTMSSTAASINDNKSKIRLLFLMTTGFSFTAVSSFTFDLIYVLAPRTKDDDCDHVFGDDTTVSYNAYQMVQNIGLLIPIWVILHVWKAGPKFQPNLKPDDSERVHLFSSEDGQSETDASSMLERLGFRVNDDDDRYTEEMFVEY